MPQTQEQFDTARIIEQIVDVSVPEMPECSIEVLKIIPYERLQRHTVERIADVPVPQTMEAAQIQEKLIEAIQLIPQERISERIVVQIVDAPVSQVPDGVADTPVAAQHQASMARTTVPPAPHGVPQIAVTLAIDLKEIMDVSDQDKSTDKSNQATITNKEGRLLQTETDHVVQEEYRNEDEVNKTKIRATSGLNNHSVTMRNTFVEEKHEDKFENGDEEKTEKVVQNALDRVPTSPEADKAEIKMNLVSEAWDI